MIEAGIAAVIEDEKVNQLATECLLDHTFDWCQPTNPEIMQSRIFFTAAQAL